MIKYYFITLGTIYFLSGCASKGSWLHTDYTPAKMKKDDTYCDSVSYGYVPMPSVSFSDNSNNNNYTTRGTFKAYDSRTGNNYTGSYHSTTTSDTGGFASGVSSGVGNGMAMGAVISAKYERLNIWRQCMISLGWIEK